jgi:hypothetical protein
MSVGVRKLAVTAHVASSLGWLGAVGSFLVLAIAGLTSERADTIRAAYVAMDLVGLYLIVALLTGLALALGTRWGLVRHYWVLVKLTVTAFAVAALLLHQFTAVSEAARRASGTAAGVHPALGGMGTQLVADAGAAVLVLLVINALGVYKPWGRTVYGRQKLEEERAAPSVAGRAISPLARGAPGPSSALPGVPGGLRLFLAVLALLVAAFIAIHLAGGGLGMHGG